MRFGRAGQICGSARVHAAVLTNRVNNVEGNVSKVMERSETVAYNDRRAVLEPLDAQIWIGDRLELGLEMGARSLTQTFDVARLREEDGCHFRGLAEVVVS